ncbi:MAG: phospho-sugar mutase [Clostridiales bacterium]|nr:phospho-sugar mutase [Clostridiales bacterium]
MGYNDEYKKWLLSPSLSAEEKAELESIIHDPKEMEDRFFAPLSFGTAGLRGIMGVGLHRMNVHVIRHATQGFASLIRALGPEAMERGIVICFDCRRNSSLFAREAASVMAGNGVRVRIFDALRPTPELSFAIREYGAMAGINITASHNTKEYNGYKVYWEDGAQLPPEHAASVASEMAKIDIFTGIKLKDFDEALSEGLVEVIGEEIDQKFLENVMAHAIDTDCVKKAADGLRIVYTPFHGSGYRMVPEVLRRLGIKHLFPVPEQMELDGDFPTVESPNPEYTEGFHLAVELAHRENASLIIGTDPDADRIGVMVQKDGDFISISGNQLGVLLMDYMINAKRAAGTLPENAAILKSIVTTKMSDKIADMNGIYIEDTFTGFKFMAEKIKDFEATGEKQVIFSYEESYGYMIGDFVRDKDAVTASMLVAEMAASYHLKGMTLYDALQSLYEKYGYYCERTLNLVMPGFDGLKNMRRLMSSLRAQPPREIGGAEVLRITDYSDGTVLDVKSGAVLEARLRGSNVLYFELSDGTDFIVRPSGTEPKIKVYIMAKGQSVKDCEEKILRYEEYAKTLEG